MSRCPRCQRPALRAGNAFELFCLGCGTVDQAPPMRVSAIELRRTKQADRELRDAGLPDADGRDP